MIKSTTSSIKFSNKNKLQTLHQFIDEYRNVVSKFIDLLWDQEKIPCLLPKETTGQIETWSNRNLVKCKNNSMCR